MRLHAIYLLAFTLLFAACSDNPIDGETHADEAVGFALFVDGTEVYRSTPSTPGDTIRIVQGDTTSLYDVQFVGEDGDLFTPDEEGTSLALIVLDGTVVELGTVEPEGWRFSLVGRALGSTTVEVLLLHGQHADFRFEGIPIVVEL